MHAVNLSFFVLSDVNFPVGRRYYSITLDYIVNNPLDVPDIRQTNNASIVAMTTAINLHTVLCVFAIVL